MATWILPPEVSTWINHLSQPLHGRLAWRLLPLLCGMLFAQGRRPRLRRVPGSTRAIVRGGGAR